MRILVAIPTYNEKDNIERMINAVLELGKIDNINNELNNSRINKLDLSLIVIDDGSPDGTQEIVKSAMKSETHKDRLFLIPRETKLGLGTAYVAAFKFAIKNGFDFVVTMDCDFSHDPKEIINFIDIMSSNKDDTNNKNNRANQSENIGLISGSRYKGGIRVINWSMKRLLISYFANIYARITTGIKISDLTGGFNMYRVELLKRLNLNDIKSRGYAFQIEMKHRMIKEAGASFAECPIIFYERTKGKSKMSKSIIFEAFFIVISLRLKNIFKKHPIDL